MNWNRTDDADVSAVDNTGVNATDNMDTEGFDGFEVFDSAGNHVGAVSHLWGSGALSRDSFLGFRSGTMAMHTYVVPLGSAQVDRAARTIRLPFAEDQIKQAPSLSSGDELTAEDQAKITDYYGSQDTWGVSGTAPGAISQQFDTAGMGAPTYGGVGAARYETTGLASDTADSSLRDADVTGSSPSMVDGHVTSPGSTVLDRDAVDLPRDVNAPISRFDENRSGIDNLSPASSVAPMASMAGAMQHNLDQGSLAQDEFDTLDRQDVDRSQMRDQDRFIGSQDTVALDSSDSNLDRSTVDADFTPTSGTLRERDMVENEDQIPQRGSFERTGNRQDI
jgi:hypothetical protein